MINYVECYVTHSFMECLGGKMAGSRHDILYKRVSEAINTIFGPLGQKAFAYTEARLRVGFISRPFCIASF
jgi:hypothetical protein